MQRIVFHFDVVSPFAYLAFERLPQGFYPVGDHLPELLLHVDVPQLVNLKA